jgi:hypothetical protein
LEYDGDGLSMDGSMHGLWMVASRSSVLLRPGRMKMMVLEFDEHGTLPG